MNQRNILLVATVAAAVGIPYHLSKDNDPSRKPAANWWESMWTVAEDGTASFPSTNLPATRLGVWSPDGGPLAAGHLPDPAGPPGGPTTPFAVPPPTSPSRDAREGPAVQSLTELLRFDVTPAWVMTQWPRVWTRFGQGDLAGWRVTLVSGVRLTDLAGSLTYYFDRQHQLQRIAFDGKTGDASELVSILSQYFGMRAEPYVGGYQMVARDMTQTPYAALRVEPEGLLDRNLPNQRYRVHMELNRPGIGVALSPLLFPDLAAPRVAPGASNLGTGQSAPGTSGRTAAPAPQKSEPKPVDTRRLPSPRRLVPRSS